MAWRPFARRYVWAKDDLPPDATEIQHHDRDPRSRAFVPTRSSSHKATRRRAETDLHRDLMSLERDPLSRRREQSGYLPSASRAPTIRAAVWTRSACQVDPYPARSGTCVWPGLARQTAIKPVCPRPADACDGTSILWTAPGRPPDWQSRRRRSTFVAGCAGCGPTQTEQPPLFTPGSPLADAVDALASAAPVRAAARTVAADRHHRRRPDPGDPVTTPASARPRTPLPPTPNTTPRIVNTEA